MHSALIANARLLNETREFEGAPRSANGRITHVGRPLAAQPGDQVVGQKPVGQQLEFLL